MTTSKVYGRDRFPPKQNYNRYRKKQLKTMKKYFLLFLLVSGFYNLKAQTACSGLNEIQFNALYTAKSDQCMDDSLTLKVSAVKLKLLCTIAKNKGKLTGYLIKDRQKVNHDIPGLYRFHLPKQTVALLLISFYKEDGECKAMIYNQDYLKIFKPCFDLKGIELRLGQ
ncbi:hypothetical protein ABIB40_003015 [Pedobacter sp. UYP30]|uniref:hypothetical protein n=1 Tax=Pedobacter sp. UYP30 TaxID=1756400 RepID=UPI00339A5620